MSNYNSLKTTINANIKQNGNQEITGQILNSVLNQMVTTLGAGYQFAGVATTATDPGSPDAKVFYIANGKGTYTNFGGLQVTEDDVVVLYWDSSWHKVSTGIASNSIVSDMSSMLDMTKYMMTLDTSGNNVFDPNYVRHGKIVRSSSPYDIFNFTGAGVTGFYRVPSTCNEIKISGIVASGTLLVRLSKTPQDNSESIPYWLSNGAKNITIDDSNKDYPYLCVGAYRVSGSDDPDLTNVKILFVGSNERLDALETSVTNLQESTKGFVKQFQNNIWKSNGEVIREDNFIDSVQFPGLTRRTIYDSFRSVRFFGCDKSIPRTIFVVWKKNSETTDGNLRISRYDSATNSWSVEFKYSGVLSEGVNQNGITCIKIDRDASGDTSKQVELLIDLSQMPSLTGASFVLNPLTSTPERVFSDTCYSENIGSLPTDVAGLKTRVSNLELDVDKLEKGFVYGADLFTINGFINSTTGNVSPHQTLKCTDFIPVLPGQVYTTLVGLGGTACNGFYVDADNNVVFRMEDDAPDAIGMTFTTASSGAANRPTEWIIHGSVDGKTWTELMTHTAWNCMGLSDGEKAWAWRTNTTPTTASTEYNGGVPYLFDGLSIGAYLPFGDAAVSVAPNATLEITSDFAKIGHLAVDLQTGAGTITRFNPAENGVIDIMSTDSSVPMGVELPIAFGEIKDKELLRTWKIKVNGVARPNLRLRVSGNKLKVLGGGLFLVVK